MFLPFDQIIPWLLAYKYVVLLPLTVIEGPIVTIIAGFLSSASHLNLWIAYLIVIVGDLLGDCIFYAIGRWGGGEGIRRWGKYVGITVDGMTRLEKHFERHAGKTLIAAKLTHAIGAIVLAAAGLAKVPIGRFVWYNFLATIPKSLALILVGYYFGRAYVAYNQFLSTATLFTLASAGLALLAYVALRRFGKLYEKDL